MEYNGSAVVAMIGKNCVAIANDMRFGVQQQTVATNLRKSFKITDRCYVGLSGLVTDMQTLHQKFMFRTKLYQLKEEREMKVSTFSNMVSSMLYEKRFGPFFCEPVIAGLEEVPESKGGGKEEAKDQHKTTTYKPFISAMDMLGAPVYTND